MRVNRPAICLPRVPANRPVSSTSRPAYTNVAGSRSAKYFSVSDTSAPARVARLMLWISSVGKVHQHQVHLRAGGGGADRVGHVGEVGAGRCGQPEEPGELDRYHPRGRGWWHGDVDDRQPVLVGGVPLAGGQFVGAAELAERGGLAGARRAADDHAAAGRDLVPVELDQ